MKRHKWEAVGNSKWTNARRRRRTFVPLVEQLEERAMLVADLQGQALAAPNAASWGSTISVQSQVRNSGTPGTNSFQVRWYLSQDATGSTNDILLNRASNQGNSYLHPGLAAASSGGNFTVNLVLPTAPPPGFAGTSFYIIMRTDAASQIVESNENNNFGQLGDGIDREAITITSPEITVLFGAQNLVDGDSSPTSGEGSAFGTVARGAAPIQRIFTVRNDGNGPLSITGITLPTGFSLAEGLPSSLAAGASDTFTVQLDTAVAGTKTGQLSIINGDANENPFNFTITGTVVAAPEVTVLFGTTDIPDGITATSDTMGTHFGNPPLGSAPVSRTFTVRNDGSATLTLGAVIVPTGYTLTESLVTSLAPGASDNFTVRLNTTTPGLKYGQVRFATNDSNENPFDFYIAGVVTVPEVTVRFGPIGIEDNDNTPDIADGTDFGTVMVGQAGIEHTFTVTNDGAAPLTLGAVSVPTGFTLTEGLVASLNPGESDTFTVRLNTAVLGTKTGDVSFATNDLDENPFNFTITGEVVLGTSDTFTKHSVPGATKVIYLDFDGHTTVDPLWNSGNPVVTPRYDSDNDTSTFSATELAQIEEIWQRVAEYYAPFDVNVTTQDPGLAGIVNDGGTDDEWGIRVVIGGDNTWYGGSATGVAYFSFGFSRDLNCFVFSDEWNDDPTGVAGTIAHEVGHTLQLSHDGRTSPVEEYYAGHGSGVTRWQPIMGSGPLVGLEQWSKGEYTAADNTEDDLAIITTQNGFGYRVDDHGNDSTTASSLTVNSATSLSGSGIIERNTDVDYFAFDVTAAGQVDIAVSPALLGRMLDVGIELYDSSLTLIDSDNPANLLTASITQTLAAGTYYVSVDGVGKGDPLVDGYTDYGSLGSFSVAVTASGGGALADALPAPAAAAPALAGDLGGGASDPGPAPIADAANIVVPPAASWIASRRDSQRRELPLASASPLPSSAVRHLRGHVAADGALVAWAHHLAARAWRLHGPDFSQSTFAAAEHAAAIDEVLRDWASEIAASLA